MKKSNFRGLAVFVAVITMTALSLAGCDTGGGGNGDIDTAALDAAILEANEAREGIETASDAAEVPEGKFWVTESEWDAFDAAFKAAAETSANPSSQPEVNTARSNLRAAIDALNDAKKPGSGAAITLSGTITVKNNGQIVPYVTLVAHADNWDDFAETLRVHLTADNTPWEIITRPFDSLTEIVYRITGYSDAQYENKLFSTDVNLRTQVYNEDVSNISINLDTNFITLSGTFSLDYGRPIPSVDISAFRKDDDVHVIGYTTILNAGNNNSWSITIPSQPDNTAIDFNIVGFDGPMIWEYDQLFAFWHNDYGVKVGSQDKSGIALNFITVSGTVDVSCNGGPVPLVEITLWKVNEDDNWDWLTWTELYSPSANAPWSIVLPAYTSDTEIAVDVNFLDAKNGTSLFRQNLEEPITVKDTNVSGIAIAINSSTISVSGTVNVTVNGNPVPRVRIAAEKKVGEDDWNYIGSAELHYPSADASWSIYIPAFDSETELRIWAWYYDEDWNGTGYIVATITVKDADVSVPVIVIDLTHTHEFEFTSTTASNYISEGFDLYTCSGCQETEKRNITPRTAITGSAQLSTVLAELAPNTETTPYTLTLNVGDLGEISAVIGNAEKYINLDCSGSTFISIGYGAFQFCSYLAGITIPNTVTSIGDYAFQSTSLSTITIPNSVTSIGGCAFQFCSELSSVTIGSSVSSIGGSAFQATGLSSVTIPDNVITIGDVAFAECPRLSSVSIGNGVTAIGNFAFGGNAELSSVTIGNSLITIEGGAFMDCSLSSVIIPNSVTFIGDYAFLRCLMLASVTIGNSVATIEDGAFGGCTSLTSVTIPGSVTSIGQWAFGSCTSLSAINVNAANAAYVSVDGVLYDKTQATLVQYPAGKTGASFTIPNSVTAIMQSAFADCTSLSSVTIPNSVTSIGNNAFFYCSKLNSVTFAGTIPSDNVDTDAFLGIGDLRDKFYASNSSAGTPGTYTTTAPASESSVWTKE